MRRILSGVLVVVSLVCIFFTNSGHAFFRQSIAAPKVNKRIAGHRTLKVVEVLNTPDFNYPKIIFQDSTGQIYIARQELLSIYNEKENLWKTYNKTQLNLPNFNHIKLIGESSDKKIWLSAGPIGQLNFLNEGRWQELPEYTRPIGTVFPSLTKGFWMYSQGELHYYDGTNWSGPVSAFKKSVEHYAPSPVIGIQDSKGFIWLAGGHSINWMAGWPGIHRYDPVKNLWAIFSESGFPDNIQHLYEDSSDNLWFANIQGDIAFLERKTGSWKTFTLSDRIPNSYNISGIIEDNQGQILFATNKGLVSFNKKYNQWNRSTSANSGLLHSWVTCMYKDRDKRIWLGTPKGIMVLEP
jgi:ligand-binding sensor domain-containing protein